MSDFKIVDKDKKAVWVLNTGEIRIPDYVRQAESPGTELVILEPGVPTKILLSTYLKGQDLIKRIKDPTQGDGIEFVEDEPEVEAKPVEAEAKK